MEPESRMAIATMKVEGMTCEHCVRAVTRALEQTEGVRRARVELEAHRAVVDYDEARTDTARLEAAVADEGYTAETLP
jgi:copper ion binding protein